MRLLNAFKQDGLKARAMRGSSLTVLNFGAQNLLRLGGNLILTRILFPEAFGIMALVTVFLTGLNMFSDMGVRASIVQNERGADPMFLDTAWVFQIIRGFVLWGVTCAIAGPMATFYEAPILAQLLPVAGLAAVIQGFNSTKLATSNREIRLGRLTMISLAARGAGVLVLILLAWWWQSVWALAIGGLVAPVITLVASHTLMPGHANRFRFERAAAGQLIKFGKFIFLSTLAGFLISQADRAILGKFVTLSDLAFYNIAFFLASVPRLIAQRLSDSILFPLYSRRPPKESVKNYRDLAKARLGVVGLAVGLSSVLALFGDTIITLLYDDRYAISGPLLVMMMIAAMPGLVTGNYGIVMLAQGDSKRFAILVILAALFHTALLVYGIMTFSVIGAALTPLVSTILFYPVVIWFIRPYGGWLPWQDCFFFLLCAGIAAVAMWLNYDAVLAAWTHYLGPPAGT